MFFQTTCAFNAVEPLEVMKLYSVVYYHGLLAFMNLQCTCTHVLTHTGTQTHTALFVSTDVRLAYLHCGGPPSAGPSPAWWPTCGRPRGPAPSLPRPVGPSRGARWKTPHYQSGSDLPGKRGLEISAPPPPSKDGNSTGAGNYSVPDQLEDLEKGWMWGMTQVDTIWGPSPTSPSSRLIECHRDFTPEEMMSGSVSGIYFMFFNEFNALMELQKIHNLLS